MAAKQQAAADALPALSRLERLTSLDEIAQYMVECSNREREVEKCLDGLLAQQGALLARVSTLKRAQPRLSQAQRDAKRLASRIDDTCTLATSVARRVRELDRAKSRLGAVRARVADILDLRSCVDGVQSAMQAGDLETAARHVQRYSTFSAEVLEEAATDAMELAQQRLKEQVRSRFEAAADALDGVAALRCGALFAQIGLADEGLSRYARFLARCIATDCTTTRNELESMLRGQAAAPTFVDALTSVYDTLAFYLDRESAGLEANFGPSAVSNALPALCAENDTHAAAVLQRFGAVRDLARHTARIARGSTGLESPSAGAGGPGPLPSLADLDVVLYELAALSNRTEMVTGFITRTLNAAADKQVARTPGGPSLHPRSTEAMQELMVSYLTIELHYVSESVHKAIALEELEAGAQTSSVMDDVFYVLQKATRRAISSLSVNAVCAMINNVDALLNETVLAGLRQQIERHGAAFARTLSANKIGSKDACTTVLNNIELGSAYVLRLKSAVESELEGASAFTAGDREKATTCTAALAETAEAFRHVLTEAMDNVSSAVQPRLKPLTDVLSSVSYELTETQYAENETNDPFVKGFVAGINLLVVPFRSLLSPNNFDDFVGRCLQYIALRVEHEMRQKRCNQLGAMQFDKDIRAIVALFSSLTQKSVREKLARLTQIATILNLDSPADILPYWSTVSWRLTATEIKRYMRLRVEFSTESIQALTL